MGPKATEPSDHGPKPLKPRANLSPSSLKLCFSGLCHSNESLASILNHKDINLDMIGWRGTGVQESAVRIFRITHVRLTYEGDRNFSV
jgi:hypothetical protein